MLEEQRVHVKEMIHNEFPLREGLKAFQAASTPGTLKVLIRNE